MEDTLRAMNECDGRGRTALMHAVNEQYPFHIIQKLLRSGASPNSRDEDGNTPAVLAMLAGYPAAEIMALVNADVANVENTFGQTLLTATAAHRPKLLKQLFEMTRAHLGSELDPSAGDNQLLIHAIKTGNEELVSDLLGAGASVRLRSRGTTPLICAASTPFGPISERILNCLINEMMYVVEV